MTYLTYAFILIGYYALHSILASSKIKLFFSKIGITDQSYRILFNLIALATTFIVFQSLRQTINNLNYSGSIAGIILIIIGVGIVIQALINYDLLAFIGLTKEKPTDELIITGLNGHLRHPLYLGILMGLVGWIIVQPTSAVIATFGITLLYVHIGIYFEEKKLIKQFGEQYVKYKNDVPKLIPRLNKSR